MHGENPKLILLLLL